MMEVVCVLVGAALGFPLGRYWPRITSRFRKPEDRDAGLRRYQAMKNG